MYDGTWSEVGRALADAHGLTACTWDDPAGTNDYETLLAGAPPLPAQAHALDEPTHILYTSGTTGTPKGALSTHGTILWQAINLSHLSGLDAGAHFLGPLPLFHAGGLHTAAMPVLHYGGRVTTMRRFVPSAIAEFLRDSERPVTHLSMIPMMYAAIMAEPAFADVDATALRCGIIAGAIAPPDLLQAWAARGARLQPQYGGTEMGPCALALSLDRLDKGLLGSQGQPPMHTEIRLVDTVTGAPADPRKGGEIWLRGPSVTAGYWGKPSGYGFEDGWFRTGDVAWRDEDGFYYYSGRSKEMYKSGGENVYPAEVELVLAEHPDISEIAVVGVPDDKWGEVGLAVVVAAEDRTPTLESVREFGQRRLAKYKLPASLVIVPELERNVTGKISRDDLKARYAGSI